MEEILGLLIPVSFVVMLVVEHFFSAKPLPKVRFWLLQGLVFFSFTNKGSFTLENADGPVSARVVAVAVAPDSEHTFEASEGVGTDKQAHTRVGEHCAPVVQVKHRVQLRDVTAHEVQRGAVAREGGRGGYLP